MHVLLLPDALGAGLGALETGAALVEGWSRGAPHDSVEVCPLADGGRGFAGLVAAVVGGRPGPDGVLLVPGTSGTTTAYIDSHRSVDTGAGGEVARSQELARAIASALRSGAGRIVVGLPGPLEVPGAPDAGAGLLEALGALTPGAGAGTADQDAGRLAARLGAMTAADLEGLAGVRERLRGVDLVGAVATDVPLLGLHGASASAAASGALAPEEAHDLERAVGHLAHVVREVVAQSGDVRPPLGLAGAAGDRSAQAAVGRALTSAPGTGAGGGLGFALCALGGRLAGGADLFAAVAGISARAERADLVVTACGDLDGASFHGSPAAAAVRAAGEWGAPCVAVARASLMSRRERAAAGLNAVVTLDAGAPQPHTPLLVRDELVRVAERLARSWSPARARGPGVLGHS